MNRQRGGTAVQAAAETFNTRRCRMKATGMGAIGRMGVVAAMMAMSVLVTPASAGPMYWDIDGDTAGSGPNTTPAGTWDAANTYWSSSAVGDVATAAWTAGDTAVFAAGTDASGTYTVTVSGTIDIGGLTFQEGTVTLGGTATLRMVANSIFDVATGRSATLSDTLTLSDDGTVPTLTKTGEGTLTVGTKRTYTGETIVNAGKLILRSTTTTYDSPLTINSNGIVELNAIANNANTYSDITVNAGGLLSPAGVSGARINTPRLYLNGGKVEGPRPIYMIGSGEIRAAGETNSTITTTVLNNENGFTYTMYVESGSTLLISGPVRRGVASSIKLTKHDVGTLILSGNNTYDGATTINGGGLIIHGDHNAASGTIAVASGARFGGGGIVSNNVTFAAGAALVFDPEWTLTLNSGKTLGFGATYTPLDLVAADGSPIDWDALDSTTFTLVGGEGTVNFTNISTDTYAVGTTGRTAVFKEGGLQLEVAAPKGTVISIR